MKVYSAPHTAEQKQTIKTPKTKTNKQKKQTKKPPTKKQTTRDNNNKNPWLQKEENVKVCILGEEKVIWNKESYGLDGRKYLFLARNRQEKLWHVWRLYSFAWSTAYSKGIELHAHSNREGRINQFQNSDVNREQKGRAKADFCGVASPIKQGNSLKSQQAKK